jgi:hypothetical protein
VTADIHIRFVAVDAAYAAWIEQLRKEWAIVRPQVQSAAGDRVARDIDGLVRATAELVDRLKTTARDPGASLFSYAAQLFAMAKVLEAPEISKDHPDRIFAAQIASRLGVLLLDLRAAIDKGGR